MALNIGSIVSELNKEKEPLVKRLEDINKTIEGLQALCAHVWQPKGRSHNKDVYQCSTCTLSRE